MESQPIDRGNYIETFTGRRFFPKSPRTEDVAIQDIAHSLALQCRYNGHCRQFYSVAEHSLSLAYYTAEHLGGAPRDILFALLHDAAEAYTSDLPRPTKLMLPEFKTLERAIEAVVWSAFGLPTTMPEWLHEIDNRILRNERDELMADTDNHWDTNRFVPLPIQIRCLSPKEAEQEFLDLALDLLEREGDSHPRVEEAACKATCSDDGANPKDLIGCKKPALHLVPPVLLLQAAEALKNGARKYGPYNWRKKGVQSSIYVSACMRHVVSWWDGEEEADDSGVHHLAHAAACLGILLDAMSIGNLKDDRPLPGTAADFIREHTDLGETGL